MVLTRSMMKEQGLRPIVAEIQPKVYRKQIQNTEDAYEVEKYKETLPSKKESVSNPEQRITYWPYYAVFVPAFMFCVWQKSAIGIVGASLLSQVVHWAMNRSL